MTYQDRQVKMACEIIRGIKDNILNVCGAVEPGQNNVIVPFRKAVINALRTDQAQDMTVTFVRAYHRYNKRQGKHEISLGQWLRWYIPLAIRITIAVMFYALFLPMLLGIGPSTIGLGLIVGECVFVGLVLIGFITRIIAIITILFSISMIVLNVYPSGLDYAIVLFMVITGVEC